jgi:hypothetical protein
MEPFKKPRCENCAPMGFPMHSIAWEAREEEQYRRDNPPEMLITRYGSIGASHWSHKAQGMVPSAYHEFQFRCERCGEYRNASYIVRADDPPAAQLLPFIPTP